jgi:ATPase subunit of ABC transporter with duplicated ATPase domains
MKSSKDLRVAMLRQEFVDEIDPTRTLREEFMTVFAEENQIMEDLAAAETRLAELTGEDDADEMQEVLDNMAKLQAKADLKNVGALESRVSKIMDLMGFEAEEGDYEVSMFSGGWKMRIGLGKVLLKDPNILLLDEPTNHLDLESVEWLEEFLRNQNLPMVIVSHDREFLDQVCTKIVDAEGGLCTEYQGNYSKFLQLKKARMDSWNAAYNAQEKKIKEERKWINKFRLKQPQAVKQREAQLEKLKKSDDYVQKPPFIGKPFKFRFPAAPRLSPEVAEVKGLSHGYGDGANPLFEDSDLFIEKGDRIAVIGPNGAGKSTLLRILMGKEEPDKGSAEIVGTNVYPAYFEQNQADVLDLDKTVVETIQGASNTQSYNELRALLGQFLFKGDDVEKKVENLSGGEKARLSLCCMMLKESNLLILDEPTNHLDIPAKEMLEEALQHFDGSVVVISHDRYFISKVATTIVAIEDKKLMKYGGDYKFYMDKSKDFKAKVEARYFAGGSRIEKAPVIDLEALQPTKKKNFGGAKTANLVTRKDKGVKNAKRNKVK